MLTHITVTADQLVAVVLNGRYRRLLQPGSHWLWTGFNVLNITRMTPGDIVERVEPGDPVPTDLPGAKTLIVRSTQRAVIWVEGRLRAVLEPGRFRLWTSVTEVKVDVVDVLARPSALADHDRLEALKVKRFTEQVASAQQGLVLLEDGAPVEVLAPGRYRAWSAGPWAFKAVPLQLQQVDLAQQDVMTADEVQVRLRPTLTYRVVDPLKAAAETVGTAQMYSVVQLALREVVAARTLDGLVSDREALSVDLVNRAQAALPDLGLEIVQAYVKDITLSADVKAILSRVAVARKEAEALAIKRREEVASTRQQANTAKVLASNPVLMRLKELEALTELAGKIDKVVVVGGTGSPTELAPRPHLGARGFVRSGSGVCRLPDLEGHPGALLGDLPQPGGIGVALGGGGHVDLGGPAAHLHEALGAVVVAGFGLGVRGGAQRGQGAARGAHAHERVEQLGYGRVLL